MRLPVWCPLCLESPATRKFPTVLVPIGDGGICRVECDSGHRTAVVLVEHRYEWLFETALSAIEDSYFREAVSSFAASLERFYEYALSIYCHSRNVRLKAYVSTWKALSKQSERQLGAFIAAHTLLEGETPRALSEKKKVQFRNDVIHRGKMPTEDEATAFGDEVLTVMVPVLANLRTKYRDAKAEIDARLEKEKFRALPVGTARVTRSSYPMALRDIDKSNVPPHPTRHYIERLVGYLGRE